MNLKKKNQRSRFLQAYIVFAVVLITSLSCGILPQASEEMPVEDVEENQGDTTAPTETRISTPTFQPSETPTESAEPPEDSRLGIEEPVEIDGVSVQVTAAYIREPENDSAEEPILTIEFPPSALLDIDWIGQNSNLICDNEIFDPVTTGLAVGEEGKLRAMLLSFEIRNDVDPSVCALHIKTVDISLASFFDLQFNSQFRFIDAALGAIEKNHFFRSDFIQRVVVTRLGAHTFH